MEKTKLNIGSGVRPLNQPGNAWLDLDVRPIVDLFNHKTYEPDIIADASKIPVEDGRFDELLAHSILEHFSKRDADKYLAEWARVLKPGGRAVISVPDMIAIAKKIITADDTGHDRKMYEAINLTYGEQDYPENTHLWGYTFKSLAERLRMAGFSKINRLPADRYDCELLVEAYKDEQVL